jgi:putative transposase
MRDEPLEINDFGLLLEARMLIGDWRHAYNHDRAHSCLRYQAPATYAATCTHQRQLSFQLDPFGAAEVSS